MMEIKTGQNLYEAIDKICGFTALDDDMEAIIDAIKQDNPTLQVKNNVDLDIVRLSLIEKPTNEIQIGWNFAMEALIAKIEVKDVTPITFSEFKIKLGLEE